MDWRDCGVDGFLWSEVVMAEFAEDDFGERDWRLHA
jgi:hypothetical protein